MRKVITILLLATVWYAAWHGNFSFCKDAEEIDQKPKLDVPYEPTSYGIAEAMLSMAKVTSKDLVYDLGCGDGRIVIMAAKERKARGIGVDIDPERIKEGRENAKAAGVRNLVRFIEQDLFTTDVSRATVMMLYLWPEVNLKLRPKLLQDLKPGTRIVSHSHTMGAWKADATRTVENHKLYLFVVPANVTGTWLWTGLNKHPTRLNFTQSFQEARGMLSGEEKELFLKCTLKGTAISCSGKKMENDKMGSLLFEGHVSGDSIKGKIKHRARSPARIVKATRDTSTMVSIAE
jgi:SAM-dependent methyltransferase